MWLHPPLFSPSSLAWLQHLGRPQDSRGRAGGLWLHAQLAMCACRLLQRVALSPLPWVTGPCCLQQWLRLHQPGGWAAWGGEHSLLEPLSSLLRDGDCEGWGERRNVSPCSAVFLCGHLVQLLRKILLRIHNLQDFCTSEGLRLITESKSTKVPEFPSCRREEPQVAREPQC